MRRMMKAQSEPTGINVVKKMRTANKVAELSNHAAKARPHDQIHLKVEESAATGFKTNQSVAHCHVVRTTFKNLPKNLQQ